MRPYVIGLDLAAEQSGLALPDGTTEVIVAPKVKGKRTLADDLARMDHIHAHVHDVLFRLKPNMLVLEDYASSLRSAAAHRLAEISGNIRLACWRTGATLALVNVKHLKIYATGSGNATKSQMATAALKRAGIEFATEDECDAAWLRWLGLDLLGVPQFPLPASHRRNLKDVKIADRVAA
ncbi:crossover junction endodeoxyribonuclease RuvC [[Actinomadura] parvosata]|uniref:crossover junction endodeoxyribonuclease RuvC n=1 Tax=[Actinomadura] parvosata TaxID=1955412 RepID=UPI00406C60E6